MPIPTTKTTTTINSFTQFVAKLSNPGNEMLWFRGCGKSSYCLVPTLYRHPTEKDTEKLLTLEGKILSRFKQRSIPYLSRALNDNWESLFFMQHSQVLTRLLDWTENPYVALYFALASATFAKEGDKPVYEEDAAVWVFKPEIWNRKVLEHITFEGGVLSPDDAELSAYSPLSSMKHMGGEPLAIYGSHNSPRIVAQRGVFVIFGKDTRPMENVYVESNFPQDCLMKLTIPKAHISSLLKSLIAIGYTDSVIFPDLGGLSREIKRFFGYWVENV